MVGNTAIQVLLNYKGNRDFSLQLKCRHLTILNLSYKYYLGYVAAALECAPNVEKLVIDFACRTHTGEISDFLLQGISQTKDPFSNKKSLKAGHIRNIEITGLLERAPNVETLVIDFAPSHGLLSFLDVKDVVKTSVLSKRWSSLWTQTSAISIDFQDVVHALCEDRISSFDWFLLQWTAPAIHKFHLCGLLCPVHMKDRFDLWIRFAVGQSIVDLRINVFQCNEVYVLPRVLLGCESLMDLRLSSCGFPSFANGMVDLVNMYHTMKGVLSNLYYVEKFMVGNDALKDVAVSCLVYFQVLRNCMGNGGFSLQLKCRHLTISTLANVYSYGRIAEVLECAPYVEKLFIDFARKRCPGVCFL
ncbi:hypothetical protein MLD38_036966 [Melastoma candidum]|uniref:Uncharacterized protein n=1 Tax=Melastoma candidum TaxID=119954 RepID=A0ACB9LKU4_9MYRT|nr:hypothetical protein MLD38_036966 [Melastoma candidum]